MFPSAAELEDTSLENLVLLDSRGFFPAPGEDETSFLASVRRLTKAYGELAEGLAAGEALDEAVGFRIGEGIPIGPEVLSEAAEETREKFDFEIDWVPGYFLSRGLGILWGGCTIVTDTDLALFFIRKDFQEKKKWFLYSRRELLSHELCHVARNRVNDPEFEEHFAYMTSSSPLRRLLGNCFRSELDALIFLVPVLILLTAQALTCFEILILPQLPFWLFAAAGPGWLLIRNHLTRKCYDRAEENLRLAGIARPRSVLFRATRGEIHEIARSNPVEVCTLLRGFAEKELRWRIIAARFLDQPMPTES